MNKFLEKLDLALIINEAIKSPKLFWRAVKAIKRELAKYPSEKQDAVADFIINKMSLIFPAEDQGLVRVQLKRAISLGPSKYAIHQTVTAPKV